VKVILAEDVNEALPLGIRLLLENGKIHPSRNGMMLESYSPVTTVYQYPSRRVLVLPDRDANPFFHLFESIWMLSGRNDLAFPQKFVKTFGQFSDDGETLNGAYGYRWRKWFGHDNLEHVIEMLRFDPMSRRAYLGMWDPYEDGHGQSKDWPCLAGDTLVQSPEGDKTISVLASAFSSGEISRWPVYGLDTETKDIKLTWMTGAWKTGRKKTVRVNFDDGSSIICTPDHRILCHFRSGPGPWVLEYTEAQNLKPGHRVAAVNFDFHRGYRQYRPRVGKSGWKKRAARTYWEFVNGPMLLTEDVHHLNEVKSDDRIENLEKRDHGPHSSHHHLGDKNPMRRMTSEQHEKRAEKHSLSLKEWWNTSEGLAERELRSKRPKDELGRWNHKVVSVTTEEEADVYDFTVPETNNAAVGTGVFVHNCNVGAQFRLRDHVLHMTVFNRSNDLLWGAYGANYVHFGFLHEYVARSLAAYPGIYTQVSDSFHAYIDRPDWLRLEFLGKRDYTAEAGRNMYRGLQLSPMPLLQKGETKEDLDHDIYLFTDDHDHPEVYLQMRTLFFTTVVCPMYRAWLVRDPSLLTLVDNDWHWAGRAWLARRA
jgi:thymidylate synthase